MDTQTLRQRSKDAPTRTAARKDEQKTIREKKLVKARRGLRSLAVAVTLPLILSVLSSCLSSPLHQKADEVSHVWYPPALTLHMASATTSSLMGLAGWLVWAEGGMRTPASVALFAAQLILGLAWAPFAHAGWVVLVLSLAKLAFLAGCARCFRPVNPFAGNLVSPCIAWAVFLVLLSYKKM